MPDAVAAPTLYVPTPGSGLARPTTDARRMSARAVLCTEARDREGDVIVVGGIDLASHQRNPVAMVDHGKWHPLPIGVTRDVGGNYTVEFDPALNVLWQTTYFSQRSQVAEQVFALIDEGVLCGNSVGLRPIEVAQLEADPEAGYHVKQQSRSAGRLVIRSELVEPSWCAIPVNPETAYAAITKSWAGRRLDSGLIEAIKPYLPAPKAWSNGWDNDADDSPWLFLKAWDEDKHPRDAGQFAEKEGEGKQDRPAKEKPEGGDKQESGKEDKPDASAPAPAEKKSPAREAYEKELGEYEARQTDRESRRTSIAKRRDAVAELTTLPRPDVDELSDHVALIDTAIVDFTGVFNAAEVTGLPAAKKALAALAKGKAKVEKASGRVKAADEGLAEVEDALTKLGPEPPEPPEQVYPTDPDRADFKTDEDFAAAKEADEANTDKLNEAREKLTAAYDKAHGRWDAAFARLDEKKDKLTEKRDAALADAEEALLEAWDSADELASDAEGYAVSEMDQQEEEIDAEESGDGEPEEPEEDDPEEVEDDETGDPDDDSDDVLAKSWLFLAKSFDEGEHPRATDGRFGDKPGEHGGEKTEGDPKPKGGKPKPIGHISGDEPEADEFHVEKLPYKKSLADAGEVASEVFADELHDAWLAGNAGVDAPSVAAEFSSAFAGELRKRYGKFLAQARDHYGSDLSGLKSAGWLKKDVERIGDLVSRRAQEATASYAKETYADAASALDAAHAVAAGLKAETASADREFKMAVLAVWKEMAARGEAVREDYVTPAASGPDAALFPPDDTPREASRSFAAPPGLEPIGVSLSDDGELTGLAWSDGSPLSRQQEAALSHYTASGGYKRINEHLRTDESQRDPLTGKDKSTLKQMQAMFAVLPASETPATVYRGLRLDNEQTVVLLRRIKAAHEAGDPLRFAGYSSCSFDPSIAAGYGEGVEGKARKGGGNKAGGAGNDVVFEISARKGLNLGAASNDDPAGEQGENEFLLDHDSVMKVAAIREVSFAGPDGKTSRRVVVQLVQEV